MTHKLAKGGLEGRLTVLRTPPVQFLSYGNVTLMLQHHHSFKCDPILSCSNTLMRLCQTLEQVPMGPITPPPNWQSTAIFRAAVASGACRRGPGGHLVVLIRSWYISHNGLCIHQPRDFAMRPQLLVRLLHALRRTWSDHLLGHETIIARAVRPPPVDSDATRRFHVIAEINRPVQTDLNPILTATREITRGGVSVPVWCTALLPTQMTSVDLYHACRPACGLHQFLIPVGGNVRRWLTPYHARVLSPGLFIPCWYDVRLQPVQHPPYETEEDITDLMQRSITSEVSTPQQTPSSTVSSSGTVLVHTFRMSSTHRLVVLDPGAQTTYFQQLVEVWRFGGNPSVRPHQYR